MGTSKVVGLFFVAEAASRHRRFRSRKNRGSHPDFPPPLLPLQNETAQNPTDLKIRGTSGTGETHESLAIVTVFYVVRHVKKGGKGVMVGGLVGGYRLEGSGKVREVVDKGPDPEAGRRKISCGV